MHANIINGLILLAIIAAVAILYWTAYSRGVTDGTDWDAKTALRGEATIANLMQQVQDIDAELQMAKQPVQVWSAA